MDPTVGAPPTGSDGSGDHTRFVGRRDVTEWRSRGGRRLLTAHDRLAARTGARRAFVTTLVGGSIAWVFGPLGIPLVTLSGAGVLAGRMRSVSPVALVVASGAGSLLMTVGGKSVVRRHRPDRRDAAPPFEHSPSFPSGHTMNATAIAGTVAYVAMRSASDSAGCCSARTGSPTC